MSSTDLFYYELVASQSGVECLVDVIVFNPLINNVLKADSRGAFRDRHAFRVLRRLRSRVLRGWQLSLHRIEPIFER